MRGREGNTEKDRDTHKGMKGREMDGVYEFVVLSS